MNEQEKNLHSIIVTGLQRMGYIIDVKFNEAVKKIRSKLMAGKASHQFHKV